jgi:hypothetical protein
MLSDHQAIAIDFRRTTRDQRRLLFQRSLEIRNRRRDRGGDSRLGLGRRCGLCAGNDRPGRRRGLRSAKRSVASSCRSSIGVVTTPTASASAPVAASQAPGGGQ